jgi:hypothetical protein
MKIVNKHKGFSITYSLAVSLDGPCKKTLPELKTFLNDNIGSSEFWIIDIEKADYEEGPALMFIFKIIYVLQVDADQERLNTISRCAVEIEKSLITTLENRKGEICGI